MITVLLLAALGAQTAPTVTGMSPAPGSTRSSPASVIVTLSEDVDPATVSAATVTLIGRGPDNAFGTGDDVIVTPASIAVSGSVITLDLTAQVLANDIYRLRISGIPTTPASHAGLFGYWKLGEGSGSQAADSSGNLRHGTLNGAAWDSGLFGNALRLNGGATRVDIHAGIVTPSWTAAVWLNRTADVVGTAASIMDCDAGTTGTSLRLEQFANDQAGITEYTVIDDPFNYIAPLNTWVHLAFSSDGTNARLHVNGVLHHTAARAYTLHVTKLGSATTLRTDSMRGLLNELQVYNRVLTPAEIGVLATLNGCVKSMTGEVVNGEYSGTFPTGNGSAGGDFAATFTVSAAPPPPLKVIGMIPAPGSSLPSAPAAVTVTLDHAIHPASVKLSTVRLVRAGTDGALGTGDDVAVVPTSVNLVAPDQIRIDLPAGLVDDRYRVTLSGTAVALPADLGTWTLDETAGPSAADSSGNGNTGTHVNNPLEIPGVVGNALRLNGVDQNVDIADVDLLSPHLGLAGEMSLSAWVRIFSLPAVGTTFPFVCKGSVGQFEYALHVHRDTTLSFSISSLAGPLYGEARAGSLPFGSWRHLAGTMKKGQFLRVYLDGVELQNQTSLSGSTGNGTSPLQIGRIGPTQSWFLDGDVDDVRVFNTALSALQVESMSSLGGAIRDTSLGILDGEFAGTFPSGNGTAGGDYSETFSIGVPGSFALVSSVNGAANVSVNPTYAWTGSANAASYTLEVATDAGFSSLVVNQAGLLTTAAIPGVVLAHSTLYFWRVSATNGGGTTVATGAPFSFTTAAAPPAVGITIGGGCGLSGLEWLLPLALLLGWRRLRSA